MEEYKHYVRVDGQNRIIKAFSTAFEQPLSSDILIDVDGGRHFSLGGRVNPTLFNDEGIPLYKYANGEVIQRTEQEIQADIDALPLVPPTPVESLQAETAELWYYNMILEGRLNDETAAIWYEIMTGGNTV